MGGEELSSGQRFAADLVAELVAAIDWDAVYDIVAPAMRRKVSNIGKRLRSTVGRDAGRADIEIAARPQSASGDPSDEVATRVKMPGFGMRSAEYRGRLIAALAADAYAAQQREILANARIEDGDVPPELTSAMKLVLEGKISSLDDDALATVMNFLEAAQTADGAYALPKGDDDRETARLPAE